MGQCAYPLRKCAWIDLEGLILDAIQVKANRMEWGELNGILSVWPQNQNL